MMRQKKTRILNNLIIAWGTVPHRRKVIENWINAAVLLWFVKWDFDAGFLTTEAAEAGSLGARRTPKGVRKLPSGKSTKKNPFFIYFKKVLR